MGRGGPDAGGYVRLCHDRRLGLDSRQSPANSLERKHKIVETAYWPFFRMNQFRSKIGPRLLVPKLRLLSEF
jgi:hypothetical protein